MKKRLRDCTCNDFPYCRKCPLKELNKKYNVDFCQFLASIRTKKAFATFSDGISYIVDMINIFNEHIDEEYEITNIRLFKTFYDLENN